MFNLTVASWQTVMLIAQMHEWDILYITKKAFSPWIKKNEFRSTTEYGTILFFPSPLQVASCYP
jgi:hypothetical protein